MSCYDKAKDLYDMLGKGQSMEAFEKHYAENCQVVEKPTGEVRQGKAAQRAAIQQWFGMVKEYHGSGVNQITANEETKTTMVENWTDITMHEGGRMKMEEVAVQRWNDDGQIEHETFYYQMGPPPSFE